MISKYFPAKPLLYTVALLILNCQLLNGTVRYVSHNGSNTPPYTSWETAADSIMSAINISVFGDTIYVANGVYEEQVTMIPGLTLIGAGMDSCIIDTRNLTFNGFVAVEFADSSLITDFRILISNSRIGNGIRSDGETGKIQNVQVENGINGIMSWNGSNTLIESTILKNLNTGVHLSSSSSLVHNNSMVQVDRGVRIGGTSFNYTPVVSNNTIECDGFAVQVVLQTKPTIRNNIIFLKGDGADGYNGGLSDTAWVYNNLVVSEGDYDFTEGLNNTRVPTIEFNNFLIGNFTDAGIYAVDFNIIKNNNIINGPKGLIQEPGETPIIQYNNSWNNETNYGGFTPDSTNLSVDPMVVNEDSLDFHLQMFSPLIDAGDPNILDIDGSRSDIGLFGGPFGERYEYTDLAPKPPRNLTAEVDSSIITLSWNRNTEADFSHYNLYRDTVKNFTIDSTKLVASIQDTFYLHIIPQEVESLYFKLTAVDNQGNESNPSEEVSVILVSVKDEWIAVNNYTLYQNYPNPFNPSTKIGYKLKERGYVKLYVYDIKGELVSVLVNQTQDAGYYEVEFSGEMQQARGKTLAQRLASGIYIYQIMVKNENNIPVFTDMKKMLMIK